MPTKMEWILFTYLILLNAYWYWVKNWIVKKGGDASWVHGHFRDFKTLGELSSSSSSEVAATARRLRVTLLIAVWLFVGALAFGVIGFFQGS